MKAIARGDTGELRRFGLALGIAVPLLFWVILPWLFELTRRPWPLLVGGALLVAALAVPRALYPVYWLWRPLGVGLAWLNTRLILGLAFYGVVLPAGWLLRLAGKLQYREGFDATLQSYRVEGRRRPSAEELENPF